MSPSFPCILTGATLSVCVMTGLPCNCWVWGRRTNITPFSFYLHHSRPSQPFQHHERPHSHALGPVCTHIQAPGILWTPLYKPRTSGAIWSPLLEFWSGEKAHTTLQGLGDVWPGKSGIPGTQCMVQVRHGLHGQTFWSFSPSVKWRVWKSTRPDPLKCSPYSRGEVSPPQFLGLSERQSSFLSFRFYF